MEKITHEEIMRKSEEAKRKKEDHIINEYIRLAAWPKWFKGLSLFEIKAADSLLNNLRDDMEQETYHRVCLTLMILGIYPLIKPKQLKEVMLLSRGNDLAFFWFLWQLHYREGGTADPKKKRDSYTHNEKIILTAISHLDTVTTLRALDKILPKQMTPKPAEKPVEKRKKPQKYDLPYFEPLRRPIRITKKPFKLIYTPSPSHYFKLAVNPHYVVANEINRWYVDHNVNPRKRICLGILSKTVNELNIKDDKSKEDGVRAPKKKFTKNLLDNVIDSLPCCESHKQVKSDEKYQENKLCVQKFKGCLKNLNPGENRKEAMRRKVLKDIDREVNAFQEKSLKELNDEYKIRQKRFQLCKPPVTVDCFKCDEWYANEEYNYFDDMDMMSIDNQISSSSSGTSTNIECDVPLTRLVFNEDDDKRPVYFEKIIHKIKKEKFDHKCDNDKRSDLVEINDACKNEVAQNKVFKGTDKYNETIKEGSYSSDTNCFFQENISGYDYGHLGMAKTEDIFFEAPGRNKPFKFLYEKIFEPDAGSYPHHPFKAANSNTKNEDDALLEYFKTEWNNEKDKWIKKYKHIDKLFKMDFPKMKVKKYSQHYYDPRDKKLMSDMLHDGITELRKDKKYVLASLPDSSQTPILQEWIRIRYNLTYTQEERQEELRESLKVFHALSNRPFKVNPVPFSESINLNYNCRNYMLKKSLEERSKYENNFRLAVLDPISTFWTAMRPYNYPGGPPRSTFYAYLPANGYSVLVFSPWKTYEYNKGANQKAS